MIDILFVNQPRLHGIAVPREIDCSNPQKDFVVQPLGLAYLAAAAREEGVKVALIDANVLDKNYDYIAHKIKQLKPKIVIGGFTAPTTYHDTFLAKVTKINSKAYYGTWGPVASSAKEYLFKTFPDLDFIIDNEPEETVKELTKNLLEKKKNIFTNVKGLSYRLKKEIKFNGYRKLLINLDKLPIPAYDLLPMDKYYTPYARRLPLTLMRTSRGCIAHCTFCITGGQKDAFCGYSKPWRAYSAQRTIKEIEHVSKKFGVKEINFFDPEFIINKQRVIDICKGIINKKLDVIWNCTARVDTIDMEVLKWMKKAGCFSISYGVESVNPQVLKNIKKNITPSQVEAAVILTKATGIQPALFFMMGLPGDTKKSCRENIKFAKYMALKYDLRPQCTIATPYPGTVFYDYAQKNHLIRGDIKDFEQTTPAISYPHLTQKDLSELHREFYQEIVLNPKRLFKRVLRIRHPNEIKNIFIFVKNYAGNIIKKDMKFVR